MNLIKERHAVIAMFTGRVSNMAMNHAEVSGIRLITSVKLRSPPGQSCNRRTEPLTICRTYVYCYSLPPTKYV